MATKSLRYVRNSELSTWSQCRLKWYLTFQLGFLSGKINKNFWLGTLVHRVLQDYYLGLTPDPAHLFWEMATQSIEQERGETIEAGGFDLEYDNLEDLHAYLQLGVVMLEGYQEWDKKNRDFEVIDSELSYFLDMTDSNDRAFTFVCRFDLLAENSEGIRVHDFKTAADFRGEQSSDQDNQFRRYPFVVREAHPDWAKEVAGSAWVGLRKIIPSARSKPPYFARRLIDLTEAEYVGVELELKAEVGDVLATEAFLQQGGDHRKIIYPTPTFDCTWKCDFYRNGLCQTWRAGLDPMDHGDNFGTWGSDPYSEYKADAKTAVPITIGRREGGD